MTARSASVGAPDEETGFPLYRQVCAVLLNQIANGEYRVGDRLPTEEALAQQFGISRVTVRLALDALERDGLLSRKRALGTFLKALPHGQPAGTLRHRAQLAEIIRVHAVGKCLLLRHGHVRPPPVVSRELGLGAAEEVAFFTKAIASRHGRRIGIKRFLAPHVAALIGPDLRTAPDFDAAFHTATGSKVQPAHGWIEAALAEPHMVMVLDVPVGSALLSVWWLALVDGRPGVLTQMLQPGTEMAAKFCLEADF